MKAKEAAKRNRLSAKKQVCLAAAVGQEHRLGRWYRVKEAKNQVTVIQLKRD
jgi:ribosomal RNA-processing protein 9